MLQRRKQELHIARDWPARFGDARGLSLFALRYSPEKPDGASAIDPVPPLTRLGAICRMPTAGLRPRLKQMAPFGLGTHALNDQG